MSDQNHASTGPTTPEGKEVSSRNALKHGGCSIATLILKTESLDDFLALEARWFHGYGINPAKIENHYEAELIRTAARADWFSLRADRNYCELESYFFEKYPDVVSWDDFHHRALQRFLRYRTSHANLVAKHRKAIEDYRRNRTQEVTRNQALQHKEERLIIHKQKNKPEETPVERIERMRKQAMALGFLTPDGKPTGKTTI